MLSGYMHEKKPGTISIASLELESEKKGHVNQESRAVLRPYDSTDLDRS